MAEENKVPVIDLEALKVDVRLLGTPQGKLIGLATVSYHGFEMDNFKVFNGENGLFLGEPTIRDSRSNGFVKTIHIRSEELREALNKKSIGGLQCGSRNADRQSNSRKKYGGETVCPRSDCRWSQTGGKRKCCPPCSGQNG